LAKYAVIIAAAGAGNRFGDRQSKILAKLDNRPLFIRAIELFVNRDDVCQTILAVAPTCTATIKDQYGANLAFMGVKLVEGAAQRWQTVRRALEAVGDDADFVAVHDAARICTTSDMIDRVFGEALECGAALLAAPLTGTVKRISAGGMVQETVSRAGLYEAQTPQVFKKELLVDAYQAVADDTQATDDADVVALFGHDVRIVDCDMSNLKITYPGDLKLAGAINKGRPKPKPSGPRGPFEEAQW